MKAQKLFQINLHSRDYLESSCLPLHYAMFNLRANRGHTRAGISQRHHYFLNYFNSREEIVKQKLDSSECGNGDVINTGIN